MQPSLSTIKQVFVSTGGAIGSVSSLRSVRVYERLNRLQQAIASVMDHVPSKLSKHADFRKYHTDTHSNLFEEDIHKRAHSCFIDGDLLEMFLELDSQDQKTIVDKFVRSGESFEGPLDHVSALSLEISKLVRGRGQ